MERNNLVALAITVTLVIIMTGSLLVPVIADASTTEKTFTNDGIYYMKALGTGDSVTYTFDGTNWTIDGEASDIDSTTDTTIIAANGVIVRANANIPGIGTPASITSLVVTPTSINMDYVKPDSTTATYSATIDVYYCAVNAETDYVWSQSGAVYVHKDSDILADGFSGVASGIGSIFRIEGNINDGFTVTAQREGVTVTDVVCDYEDVDGYEDLYKINKITFTSTYNGTVRTQTFTSYVVPEEVTSELSQHLDSGQIAILAAIPVLIIVALIVAIVSRRLY